MFVWNAISSMVRMMREMSSLPAWMAAIAVDISWTSATPRSAAARAWRARPLTLSALSALSRVPAASSWIEALVCSMAAAWTLAPWASDWLALETWPAAATTWREPSPSSRLTRCSTLAMRREMIIAIAAPVARATSIAAIVSQVVLALVARMTPAEWESSSCWACQSWSMASVYRTRSGSSSLFARAYTAAASSGVVEARLALKISLRFCPYSSRAVFTAARAERPWSVSTDFSNDSSACELMTRAALSVSSSRLFSAPSSVPMCR